MDYPVRRDIDFRIAVQPMSPAMGASPIIMRIAKERPVSDMGKIVYDPSMTALWGDWKDNQTKKTAEEDLADTMSLIFEEW